MVVKISSHKNLIRSGPESLSQMKREEKTGIWFRFLFGRIFVLLGVLRLLAVPFVGTSTRCSMHQGCCLQVSCLILSFRTFLWSIGLLVMTFYVPWALHSKPKNNPPGLKQEGWRGHQGRAIGLLPGKWLTGYVACRFKFYKKRLVIGSLGNSLSNQFLTHFLSKS